MEPRSASGSVEPIAPAQSAAEDRPGEPRPADELASIRLRNRRREYLARHPEYFDDPDHELADPVLYEMLIQTFHTPAERSASARVKGFGRVLEGDLLRGEAKLARLDARRHHQHDRGCGRRGGEDHDNRDDHDDQDDHDGRCGDRDELNDRNGSARADGVPLRLPSTVAAIDAQDYFEAEERDEGLALWRQFLHDRFVHREDADFNYDSVDANEEYDVLERQDAQDAWFDDEAPESNGPDAQGQTGVQDF